MKDFIVTFVCTGNMCRSPMAEGILKDLVIDEAEKHHAIIPIMITSAGTHAAMGGPASHTAVKVMNSHGINLNFHLSKPITETIVRNSDLIITMERNHTEIIKRQWPFCTWVYELKNFSQEVPVQPFDVDIFDPIGMGQEIYEEIFDELYKELSRVKDIIFAMVREKSGN